MRESQTAAQDTSTSSVLYLEDTREGAILVAKTQNSRNMDQVAAAKGSISTYVSRHDCRPCATPHEFPYRVLFCASAISLCTYV